MNVPDTRGRPTGPTVFTSTRVLAQLLRSVADELDASPYGSTIAPSTVNVQIHTDRDHSDDPVRRATVDVLGWLLAGYRGHQVDETIYAVSGITPDGVNVGVYAGGLGASDPEEGQ